MIYKSDLTNLALKKQNTIYILVASKINVNWLNLMVILLFNYTGEIPLELLVWRKYPDGFW